MPTTFTKIASVSVGAGGSSGMDFTSIPSTYTDLCLKVSARSAFASTYQDVPIYFNNNGSGYTLRRLFGNGSTASSSTSTGPGPAGGLANSATSTSNTFSNFEIYIPNYAGSTFKSYSIDSVIENNATAAFIDLQAGLWSNTAAINQIAVSGAGQTFVQYSTATLYGVTNS
jgi:hypothetical protein